MDNKTKLCELITERYPYIDQCCIETDTAYDKDDRYWVLHLKRGNQLIKHHLSVEDAELCVQGKQCLNLGIEMTQYQPR